MFFKDRAEAAGLLAEKLSGYRGRNPLILAIPRGAVPMAEAIAEALDGDLDVVLVHKLAAPGQPELAIGSVDEKGHVYLGEYAGRLGVGDEYIVREKKAQMTVLRSRRARYTPVHPAVDPSGRVVIVVDDGIATGATMVASLRTVRARKPSKLIAATAVASREALPMIQELADEVVCLEVPEVFYAVGQFFLEFPQVSDEEVITILKRSRSRTGNLKR
ncbi:MAG TPA: phosphoribosyltransferase family protein [Nitrospiria bacterium]|nr:phosphoribosyltransferase family protein [Nitrospiria bacterium]